MKLVVDLRLINASGIGTYLKNVFPNIINKFDEVVALGNKEELLEFDWSEKVEIIDFNFEIYLLAEQINYVLKIPQCDVYWSPHFNAPLFPIKAKKIVVTIHDTYHLANPDASYFKRNWAKVLYYNAAKRSDVILTNSLFSKTEIANYLNVKQKKIQIVSCGVSKVFSLAEDKNGPLSDYLLYVGNVKPHKNLITLLKAYNTLDPKIKEKHKMVILGKKDGFITNDNDILDFIEANNLSSYVHFTGYIADEEVPAYYKNAAIFIFPSLYEGFGLPILEAMASGTPVLSSNSASLPEVGGDAVLYFDPLNDDDLRSQLVLLLENKDLQKELVEKGKLRTTLFSWENVVLNHLKIFDTLF